MMGWQNNKNHHWGAKTLGYVTGSRYCVYISTQCHAAFQFYNIQYYFLSHFFRGPPVVTALCCVGNIVVYTI